MAQVDGFGWELKRTAAFSVESFKGALVMVSSSGSFDFAALRMTGCFGERSTVDASLFQFGR